MPQWITVGLIVLGVLLLLGAVGAAGYFGWKRYERRLLLRVVSRREALTAAGRSLEEAVERLSVASDDALMEFADDPDSVERRVLHETASVANHLVDELDTIALSKRLIPAAEALADAAYVVGLEAGRVGDDMRGESAIDALAAIDLSEVASRFAYARTAIHDACDACRLDDSAVYGGGLYL